MQQPRCPVTQYFCTAPLSLFPNKRPFGQTVSYRIWGEFAHFESSARSFLLRSDGAVNIELEELSETGCCATRTMKTTGSPFLALRLNLEAQREVPNKHRGFKNNNCECVSVLCPCSIAGCQLRSTTAGGARCVPTEQSHPGTFPSGLSPDPCQPGGGPSCPRPPSLEPTRQGERSPTPPTPPRLPSTPRPSAGPRRDSQSARAGPGRAWVHPTRSHVPGGGPVARCACAVAPFVPALGCVCPAPAQVARRRLVPGQRAGVCLGGRCQAHA